MKKLNNLTLLAATFALCGCSLLKIPVMSNDKLKGALNFVRSQGALLPSEMYLFPESVNEDEVTDFTSWSDTSYIPEYRYSYIFSIQYSESEYAKEKTRLENVKSTFFTGDKKVPYHDVGRSMYVALFNTQTKLKQYEFVVYNDGNYTMEYVLNIGFTWEWLKREVYLIDDIIIPYEMRDGEWNPDNIYSMYYLSTDQGYVYVTDTDYPQDLCSNCD